MSLASTFAESILQTTLARNSPDTILVNRLIDQQIQQSSTALERHIEKFNCKKCIDATGKNGFDDLCYLGQRASKLDDRVMNLK